MTIYICVIRCWHVYKLSKFDSISYGKICFGLRDVGTHTHAHTHACDDWHVNKHE